MGRSETVNAAIDCTRKGGTVTLIGNIQPEVTLPLQKVVTRQIRLQGSCASAGEFPQAVELIASGKIKVRPLISAIAPLEEGPRWFERLHAREPNLMKVILTPNRETASRSIRTGTKVRQDSTPHSDRDSWSCCFDGERMSNELFELTGQVAIVTGTSRGLGQYLARALAKAGADLVITSRKRDALADFEAEIKALGRRVAVARARCARSSRASARWPRTPKPPSGRFTSSSTMPAATSASPRLKSHGPTGIRFSTRICAAHSLSPKPSRRGMIAKGYGRIVNIGSVTSVFGYAGLAPYGASRGGVRQLTMSLADDWGKFGVTVNCLAPGWFKTEQNKELYENREWVDYLIDRIPAKRPGQPHDLDGAVVFLASEASRYVTGQTLLVDGGISVGSTRATIGAPKKT